MRVCRGSRAFSLIELLIAAVILTLLLFAVGDAITLTLRSETRDVGRVGSNRTVTELAARLREEARSSTAVFVPRVDVNGSANDDGHEVDFFRRSSFGADAFVAYLFDSRSGQVVRDEYSTSSGLTSIAHSDLAAGGISAFSAQRMDVGGSNTVVDGADVKPVSILYGRPEVSGGNAVVLVSVQTGGGTTLVQSAEIHLAAKAAPTSLAVVVPAGTPQPTSKVIKIPFVIVEQPSTGKILLPHGPRHQGDPGNLDPTAGIHSPVVAGLAVFYGSGTGVSWSDVSANMNVLADGTYQFKGEDGAAVSVTISCELGPCPQFVPLPVSDPKDAPAGGVVFGAAP